MTHFRQAILVLDQKEYQLTPGKINSFDTFYVDFQREDAPDRGVRYSLFIHPKQDVLVEKIELQFEIPSAGFHQAVTYGLHSATESAPLTFDQKTTAPAGLLKNDPYLPTIPAGKGLLHAWSLLQLKGDKQQLWVASTNESTGFTSILYDAGQQILTVRKDVGRGMRMTHSFPALDLSIGPNAPAPEHVRPPVKALVATQPGNLPEAQLVAYLEKIRENKWPFTHFLLGNGWQTHHGDWLQHREAQAIAGIIARHGLKPALTLSPFTAGIHSELARRNPDWLVRHNGKPVQITAANGSLVYALDVYHGGVREYLSGVFHLLHERCGYDMFVLEDVYAACLVPKAEKTRGQVMHEGLSLLQQITGKATLIGAQVPTAAAAGYFDAIIAGIPAFQLQNDRLELLHQRLPVQSLLAAQALRNSSWSLCSHPVALRPVKNTFNANAQYSWLVANALLTDVLIVQDDISTYPPEVQCEMEEALNVHRAERVTVQPETEPVLHVQYTLDKKTYQLRLNTGKKAVNDGETTLGGYECL
jgi:alpha-galactosidase